MSAAPSVRSSAQHEISNTTIAGPHSDRKSCARRPKSFATRRSSLHSHAHTKGLKSPVPARAYKTVRKTSSSPNSMSSAPLDTCRAEDTVVPHLVGFQHYLFAVVLFIPKHLITLRRLLKR